jgi:2-succinyl-5-enolpyruvyl-6-hydroxy-3-cyclohexene-1-carboxylate synthase
VIGTTLPAVDPEATQAWCRAFLAQLVSCGVQHVAVSPGSRSTPMMVAADRTDGLELSVHLDERSGAFFALGLARASRRPVAVLCTSGTAAANYLPAVVEAFHSGVPLLVLTTDRPPELRGIGAPRPSTRYASTAPTPGGQPTSGRPEARPPERRPRWHTRRWCGPHARHRARYTSTSG